MNCKKFETWLSSRNVQHEDSPTQEADSHLSECEECRQAFHLDTRLESHIKSALDRQDLPEGLYKRIESGLDRRNGASRLTVKNRTTIKKMVALIAGISLVCALVYAGFFARTPKFKSLQQLSAEAVTKHLDGDLRMSFDAAGIDQALVMLSKELRFNVILPDLSLEGCVLLGGRICTVSNCRSAYLLYKKNAKTVSLFIMDYDHLGFEMADGSRFNNMVKGYRTDIWKKNAQVYAMVY